MLLLWWWWLLSLLRRCFAVTTVTTMTTCMSVISNLLHSPQPVSGWMRVRMRNCDADCPTCKCGMRKCEWQVLLSRRTINDTISFNVNVNPAFAKNNKSQTTIRQKPAPDKHTDLVISVGQEFRSHPRFGTFPELWTHCLRRPIRCIEQSQQILARVTRLRVERVLDQRGHELVQPALDFGGNGWSGFCVGFGIGSRFGF